MEQSKDFSYIPIIDALWPTAGSSGHDF